MTFMEFETSTLWQAAFGERPNDRFVESRASLKRRYLDLREKVAVLVAQISKDIPNLTVHDITHLDALWETASLVAGPGFAVNPAEAYVLGASILFHDAGMCLAAFPNRVDDLRTTIEWRDTVMSLLRQEGHEEISESMLVEPPDSILKPTIGEVLRLLHAKRAMDLPFVEWRAADGQQERLIEDVNLRTFYGPVIGKIAYSHHVSASQLESLLGSRLGALSTFPSEWTVDPITIACLLRCADAAHIDGRRAPRFLQTLIRPDGVSTAHWAFQSKLGRARVEGDALVYTSGPEFDLDEADAWWLCFDTVGMINSELSGVDVLLENTNRTRFSAKRVRGTETPLELAKYIRTKNWTPVDTQLRISDVPRVVRLFGGEHLYGNDLRIPLRELVQNASDAIRARRILQNLGEEYGEVLLRLREEADGYWLDVVDDGIGMSERTMTESLLDFGKSFWTSDSIKLEFPGLIAKGMVATGRFGVGFFSVFMLGDFVKVTSCRYDAAFAASKTLEFRFGLKSRPILREARPEEYPQRGGTRISVQLRNDPYSQDGWLVHRDWFKKERRLSMSAVLGPLCPNLDVKLTVIEGKSPQPILAPNDWITIDGWKLLARLHREYEENAAKQDLAVYGRHLRFVQEGDQKPVGRACIWGVARYSPNSHGCVTAGGLTASELHGIGGVLLGTVHTIARDSAMPIVSAEVLSAWASEQAQILYESPVSAEEKLNAVAFILQCGGDPGELPIAQRGSSYLNSEQLRNILAEELTVDLFDGDDVEYDEESDECHPRDFREFFERADSVIYIRKSTRPILKVGSLEWPRCIIGPTYPERVGTYLELVRSIIDEAWGNDWDEVTHPKIVGVVIGSGIIRNVITISRPDYEG